MQSLREVDGDEELKAVKDKMEQYLPYSANVHGLIDVMLKTKIREDFPTKVFVPGEPESSSLVIVTPSCSEEVIQSVCVFWDAEKEDEKVILRLLKILPDWKWAAPVLFRVSHTSVSEKLQEYVRNGHFGKMWCYCTFEGSLYSLEKTNFEIEIPEGFSVTSPLPKDIAAVMAPWQSKWSETPKDFESLVTHLPSVGILDDSQHRLVSWSLLYRHGFGARTFTLPEYRRRGFASAVTLAMASKMRQIGLPVRLAVEAGNEASKKCHEKLGFEKQCDVLSFVMLPEGTTLETWVKKY